MTQEPTPNPVDVARQAALDSIEQLIEPDKIRLLQLKKELEKVEQVRRQLLEETSLLEKTIGDRRRLAKGISGVERQPKRESTACVL